MTEYTHEELDKEVQFIAGNYRFIEEDRLPYKGRDIVYVVGVAVVDNSCCGTGGCRFIRVPGYVVSWKATTDGSNLPVSTIEPIKDEEERKDIKNLLDREYQHTQIFFDDG
ncbi:MAG: hypothetical protein JXC33_09690 [Deltaproteobacteria bacterium]|nr:hypothetical protein [Deltaproteobacteria bacterium]